MAQKKHNVHFDITADDKASKALAAVEQKLTGVVLAAVSIGGVGASFVAFMNDAIKTRSALDDLADTTGDNVKTLDALRRQAVISGVEFESMGGAITKFARNLNVADDEGKAAAQAIEAMGLNVATLRAMKPADAMIEVARALGQFEDGAGKVAVAVALMGKEGAKMLPFLKDIADAGELNGRITAEQAAAAERTEKEWRKLTQSFKDGKEALANELIPILGDYIEQLREGLKIMGGWGPAIMQLGTINPFKPLGKSIAEVNQELEQLDKMREKSKGDKAAKTDIDATIASLRKEKEFLQFMQRQQALKKTGPEFMDARDYQAAKKPKLDFVPTGPDKKDKDDSDKRRAAAERDARYIVEGEEQAAKDTAEAWNFYTKQQLSEQEIAAKAQAEMWAQVFKQIDEEQEQAIEDGKVLLDGLNQKAKDASEAARQLGLTFSSAFEEAIAGGKGLREIVQGLAMDLAKMAVRKSVTEPLATSFTGLFRDFDLGKIFNSGGAEQLSGPRAEGGPVSSGGAYLVGEKGPEIFTPSSGGQIIPNSALGGGGGVTIHQHMSFGSDVDRSTLRSWAQTVRAETLAAVADQRRRGGAFAGSFGG